MSSWAEQRNSIRRAVEAGASARTSGQGSELLRLPSGQQLLLSRPNGQPTRAGQFYYQLAGRRAPSRRFNENQQLVREGPNDYIYIPPGRRQEAGAQPAAGRRVPRDQAGQELLPRQVDRLYLAHMPVRIRGRRRSGQTYERETLLPVALDGLGRQNDSLGEVQAHRNVIAAALRKMGEFGATVMELSEETYTYDASRDWAVSKQTMQVVDNRVETEVALNRRLGVLHLPQELGAQGRHRDRDPGVLRLAQGAAVHRQLPRADARLLRAARQGAAARGLLHLPRPRLLLPQRRRRGLL